MSDTETQTDDMPITTTSISSIIIGNAKWLLFFIFYPIVNWMITIFPDWKNFLENFKLIGGTVIIVLVVIKLLLEIRKLKKDK